MALNPYIIIALLAGLFSGLGTFLLLPILRRHVMDEPNARSNHKAPVPRGGGIAMIAAALAGFAFLGAPTSLLASAVLLAIVSFIDDLHGLPPLVRFCTQVLAVACALSGMHGRIFPELLPHWLEYTAMALAWLWFINLTNFMDGIDGISAMEAIMICAGIILLRLAAPWLSLTLTGEAAVLAMAAYGFYLFNRSPARLFMGDVGSIPLGFLIGYLLLELALHGYVLSALILPAYYLLDASLTLVRRLARGEKIWQAHSEHAYQKAVRAGLTHGQVVARISWLNALLIALAMTATVSMMAGALCLIAAYGLTFCLIHRFTHASPA